MQNENRNSWLGCKMVYSPATGQMCHDLPDEKYEMFYEYIRRINKNPDFNVWYDEQSPKIFGADETYLNSPVPNEASFLDTKEDFAGNKKYGLPSVAKYQNFFDQNNEIVVCEDGFYEAISDIEKYKDSTILIIGGGPSTNHCNWQDEERDYTWTCNHFYKNEKITDCKIDLFYINAETHMGIAKLNEYIKKHNTVCAADTTISRPNYVLESFRNTNCKTLLFSTRMFLTSGAAPKLVCLALLLGAKKIKIVGMDGWTKEQIETMTAGEHAFENGKKLKISSNYSFDFQRRENVVFWDYMLTNYPNVEFKNIGQDYKNNSHAEITKKILP